MRIDHCGHHRVGGRGLIFTNCAVVGLIGVMTGNGKTEIYLAGHPQSSWRPIASN